jgi:7,8-dihydroneopterin aldolase/epimerase/oxygenase
MSTPTRVKKAPQKAGRPSGAEARAKRPTRLRRVFVHDLEIVASIGVYEHEKRYEQRVLISADLWVRDDYDGVSDRLADVLDYGKVLDDIIRLAQSEHVHLNETLAERIARQCLTDARVERVRVSIAKPDVTRSCRSVGIEIEREREGSGPQGLASR